MKAPDVLLMELFVEIVDQHRQEQGLKQGEFAEKCWPESTPRVASMRWQTMRSKAYNTDKPQGVLISDAYRMATVLGIDLPHLMLESIYHAQDATIKSK